MDKVLSIVVPSYNMEKLLPRCINSMIHPILDESLEIIIVNDGSKDSTLEIASNYNKQYPNNIIVIDKQNGNYGSAVNAGLAIASGKYFRILDADDFVDNQSLNKLISHLSNIDVDIVCTNYSAEENSYKSLQRPQNVQFNHIYNFLTFDLYSYKIPNYCMHGITYKRVLLINSGLKLQEGISYTDSEYCYYPLSYAKTIIFFDILLYRYQLGRIGQTVSVSSLIKSKPSMLKIIYRMLDDIEHFEGNSLLLKNKAFVSSSPIALFYITTLCYEHNNSLLDLQCIEQRISKINYLYDILSERNLYGVKYIKRYREGKKSNTFMLRFYYKSIMVLRGYIKSALSLIAH